MMLLTKHMKRSVIFLCRGCKGTSWEIEHVFHLIIIHESPSAFFLQLLEPYQTISGYLITYGGYTISAWVTAGLVAIMVVAILFTFPMAKKEATIADCLAS